MRNVMLVLLALGMLGATPEPSRAIDPAHSSATFSVQHIFVSRVTGTVPIVAGIVTLAPGTRVPSFVSATLDPAGITSGDRDRDKA
ncbi:MAG: YceI family protein, partial [Vulcanimicrobiaceae bacterium]